MNYKGIIILAKKLIMQLSRYLTDPITSENVTAG
jgi:hypothetical protein